MTGSALVKLDLMPRQRTTSYHSHRPQSTADMKAQQADKIREIAHALVSAGFSTLDAQAHALGLCRSTTWTILKCNYKASGLSAKVISRILAVRQSPPVVRAKILEYVEQKASGHYGHSAKIRRKFITALSTKRIEQQAKALKAMFATIPNGSPDTFSAKRLQRRRRAGTSESVEASAKLPRSRKTG
jgi:hypothetical protein